MAVFLLAIAGLSFIPTTPVWRLERTTFISSGLAIWAMFIARDVFRPLSRTYLILNRNCLLIRNRSNLLLIPWSDIVDVETLEIGTRRLSKVRLKGRVRSLSVTSLSGKDAESHVRFRQIAKAYWRLSQRRTDAG